MSIEILHRYTRAVLRTVEADTLRGANLRGADLTGANLTGAHLTGADLTWAHLTGADLTGADLTWAHLTGADLRGADLTWADLRGADLTWAHLTGADLRGAPVVPNLHTAILAALESGGHLDMDAWHSCDTTHCRAGWTIVLAGDAGKKLEAELGPAIAGALIAIASCPALEGRVPNFYATNDEAMADIKRLAALESK
jgi:uncharacterized protein YjbI with pentapeptide repeats